MTAARIEELEPKNVWGFFAGLAATPRPSKKEEQVRAHVLQVAQKHGLTAREDGVGNIVVDVPASAGCEAAPITVLQAHLDMVCEKNSGTEYDFEREGIRTIIDEDPSTGCRIVRGDGTTLGADNGIGVAMGFAAATSDDVTHGPLELLFTIDEEAGMTGAKALTPESFKGRRLINLDSEEDNALYIGCAGGRDTTLTWDFSSAKTGGGEAAEVSIEGLRGGHSGGDIHENRGNAIKLLARTLAHVDVEGLQILEAQGGSKRNAIPREARAVVTGPSGTLAALQSTAAKVAASAQLESAEPGLKVRVAGASGTPSTGMSADDTERLLTVLMALPHGVQGMSPAVPGLVQTSNNVATFSAKAGGSSGIRVEVATLSRSSSEPWKSVICAQIAAVGRLAGADIQTANDYAGWEPDVDSALLATCRRVYESLFKEAPEVAAIHAGLECGIIGKRVGKMDMISLGPTITGAHSPDECVFIDAVAKSWTFLKAVLAELSKA